MKYTNEYEVYEDINKSLGNRYHISSGDDKYIWYLIPYAYEFRFRVTDIEKEKGRVEIFENFITRGACLGNIEGISLSGIKEFLPKLVEMYEAYLLVTGHYGFY